MSSGTKVGIDRDLEREANRLLAQAALKEEQSPSNEHRGPRKYAGPVLRKWGVLSEQQLAEIEDSEVRFPDGWVPSGGGRHTHGIYTQWPNSAIHAYNGDEENDG